MHVNGEEVKAFTMFAVEAHDAGVGTIERQVNNDGLTDVIQQAFQNHHGLQCEFYMPGIMLLTTSLLIENPKL